MITFALDGAGHRFDQEKLMFSEAMELQRQAGLTAAKLNEGLAGGDTAALGAMFWIARIRRLAADSGASFRDTARDHAFADFDFDLMGALSSLVDEDKENPTQPPETAAPDGAPEPTFPGTSEPLPERTSPPSEPSTSASSPSTSESAPGSGTD